MFLKWEFTYKTDSRPKNTSSETFDKRSSDLIFVAFLVKNETMPQMVDDYIGSILKSQSTKKPWIPSETIISYVRFCMHTKYTSTSNSDYKYDVKMGGTIAYYKLSCIAANGHSYIGIAAHDNTIVLGDIEDAKRRESRLNGASSTWDPSRILTDEGYAMKDNNKRVHINHGKYLELVNNLPVG
uniref:DDE Tnp4 domain-containing protein n=1 Tax=Steinernema glaseri TaxID=37863 RepID=A0A1I8AG74_9BILA